MSGIKKTTSSQSCYNRRRRFNDDQIKSLETTFETEARPELRLKQHLASKLGLQPRQVAIWFQNKRARSKSKHLERDYDSLKSDFDELALKFEGLKKENQNLLNQVERLRKMAAAEKRDEESDNKGDEKFVISNKPSTAAPYYNDMLCIGNNSYLENDEIEDEHFLNLAQQMNNNNGEQSSSDVIIGGGGGDCSFESCSNFMEDDNTVIIGGNNNNNNSSLQWWDI